MGLVSVGMYQIKAKVSMRVESYAEDVNKTE
jgi:hypothetical protein